MIRHIEIADAALWKDILRQKICFGGNKNLKIYGRLNCSFGKRMKRENRIFFASEKEALQNEFRPCGPCMRREYKKWKDGFI